MKKITVYDTNLNGTEITAPDDKTMAIDTGLLQHGVLAIGEYGTSGQKVAVFKDWAYATYDAEDAGYIFKQVNPF